MNYVRQIVDIRTYLDLTISGCFRTNESEEIIYDSTLCAAEWRLPF